MNDKQRKAMFAKMNDNNPSLSSESLSKEKPEKKSRIKQLSDFEDNPIESYHKREHGTLIAGMLDSFWNKRNDWRSIIYNKARNDPQTKDQAMNILKNEIKDSGYTYQEAESSKHIPSANERDGYFDNDPDAKKHDQFYKAENGMYYHIDSIRFNENAINRREPTFMIDFTDKQGRYVNSLPVWSVAEFNDMVSKGLVVVFDK